MASASVSELILFIAGMVVAASVAGTLTAEVDRIDDAITDRSLDVADGVRTDVEVISDPGSPVYNTSGNGNVTVYVRNTGSLDLPANSEPLDVILDGRIRTNVSVTHVEGADTWYTGSVIELEVSAPNLDAGDHRLKLVVEGDEEVFEFRT